MRVLLVLLLTFIIADGYSQKEPKEVTQLWAAEPPVVKPAKKIGDPPSDAIILFDGTNANAFTHKNGDAVKWTIEGNALVVKGGSGGIFTKANFGDCQLHIEWRTPAQIQGEGQGRGNSGVFFLEKYEVQILDSYQNPTYINGQAASVYKQHIPLVNASLPPGEWQSFDIIFTAPRFGETGRMIIPAYFTVFHNGVLVQNNVAVWGTTVDVGTPTYDKHDVKGRIMLQDHGNPTAFRNIWIRPL